MCSAQVLPTIFSFTDFVPIFDRSFFHSFIDFWALRHATHLVSKYRHNFPNQIQKIVQ